LITQVTPFDEINCRRYADNIAITITLMLITMPLITLRLRQPAGHAELHYAAYASHG